MSLIRTRGALIARYIRETKKNSTDVSDLRQYFVDGWAQLWSRLAKSNDTGLGQKFYSEVVAVASDTWTPPADFRSLEALEVRSSATARSGIDLTKTSWKEVFRDGYDLLTGQPQFYIHEGPTADGTPTTTPTGSVFRFFPGLSVGQLLRVVYITQEPSLGDPADPNDDVIAIDLLDTEFEQALVDLVRARASNVDDEKERAIATALVLDSLDAALAVNLARDNFTPHRLESYRSSNGWVGY